MQSNPTSNLADMIRDIMKNFDQTKPKSTRQVAGAGKSKAPFFIQNFRMRPAELISYLSSKVTKQDEAIRILATKVCGHYNYLRQCLESGNDPMGQADRIKSNILLIGPTGVGKTFLIRLLAHKIGVPFIKVDATKFTVAGYVGGDVEDIIRDLANNTKNSDGQIDVGMAQYGIVFIDECDKLALRDSAHGIDVSHRGVQQALLTIIEETNVALKQKLDLGEQMKLAYAIQEGKATPKDDAINTRNILFIFAGAFPDLESIVAKRTNPGSIGFGAGLKKDITQRELKKLSTQDLIEYGLEPEFVGRIPIRAILEDLTEEDLYTIIKHPESPIVNKFKEEMLAYGILVDLDDEVLRMVAALASQEKTGARGLVAAFNELLGPYETYLPDINVPTECTLPIKFSKQMVDGTIDKKNFVMNLKQTFHEKLQETEDRNQRMASADGYADEILRKYDLQLIFTNEARKALSDIALNYDTDARIICGERFHVYENAFRFLKERGCDELVITKDALENPLEFLEGVMKRT